MHDERGFEDFRRERNKRRMEGGPLRPLGQNASVLKEIEAAEAREVRNQKLTREVHEFFADATRTAATIVTQVAENAEQELEESVTREMSDFLTETMRRVQQFVQVVQTTTPEGVAQTEVSANMQNIVGQVLDEFRFAGDVATAESHVGQDPFAGDLDLDVQSPLDSDSVSDEPSPIDDHLVAETCREAEVVEVEPAPDPLVVWFAELKQDDELLRMTLKLLVHADVMTKDEARAIYRAR